jgi:hypothetical protein
VIAALGARYLVTEGRLLLFAAPPFILFTAAGLVQVGAWLGRPFQTDGRRLAVIVAAFAGVVWGGKAILYRVGRYENDVRRYFFYDVLHDVEPVIAQLSTEVKPSDPVTTSRNAGEQFRFYAHGRLPQARVCTRAECKDQGLKEWLPSVRRQGWMILLTEEDGTVLRRVLWDAGFEQSTVGWARGTLLWRITRRGST